jgi:prolyl oligopeptidase
LRAEQDVGHGLRAVSRSVELLVDTFAFFAHQLGLEVEPWVRQLAGLN